MGPKSSVPKPRRKSPAGRVELVLTGVLPSEATRTVDTMASASDRSSEPAAEAGERARWIAEAAYYRAERRGFAPGFELADWAAAEAEYTARQLLPAFEAKGPAN